jgi:hypothetical protein
MKQFARLPELNCSFAENHLLEKIKSEGYKQRTELRFFAAQKRGAIPSKRFEERQRSFARRAVGIKKGKAAPSGVTLP